MEFKPSQPLTLGVELELQLVNTHDYNLTRAATDLLERLAKAPPPGEVKPEITDSMIELSTGVHQDYAGLLTELRAIRDAIVTQADILNLAICGGGAHPFQVWKDQRIYEAPRFRHISDLYGYLAKQFTVFGQHVHIGCASGDDAIYLAHMLARYIPHFIVLAATSPYQQGADTRFDSSRLTAVAAFPLSGRVPFVKDWNDFRNYFEKMRGYGVVESMKDFYWDVRPKPEFGTVEIRVFDTPLTVRQAALLAAYTQSICRKLLRERKPLASEDTYLVYSYNRFQACRFGFQGDFIDPQTQQHIPLSDDILATLDTLAPDAGNDEPLALLREAATQGRNGARWMRETYDQTKSLSEVVRRQAQLWRSDEVLVGI